MGPPGGSTCVCGVCGGELGNPPGRKGKETSRLRATIAEQVCYRATVPCGEGRNIGST